MTSATTGNPDMAAVLAAVRAEEAIKGQEAFFRDAEASKFVTQAAIDFLAEHRRAVPYFDALMLVRTRLFYEEVCEALRRNTRLTQLVSLGAGYSLLVEDAAKHAAQTVDLYECDHPSVLERKRRCLGRDYPAKLVGADLEHEIDDLPSRLTQHGWCHSRRTIVVMEGLVYYLRSPEAICKLLLTVFDIAGSGGSMLFDVHTDQRLTLGEELLAGMQKAGVSTRIEPASAWCMRLEEVGFILKKFAAITALDRWGRLAPFGNLLTTSLFLAETPCDTQHP